MRKYKIVVTILLFILSFSTAAFTEYEIIDDNLYLEGYINSILQKQFNLDVMAQVRSGEVFLPESVASLNEYERLIEEIRKVKGVKAIKLVTDWQMKRIKNVWLLQYDTLFRPLIADPRWPEFSAGYKYYSTDINFKSSFEAVLGKSFSILRSDPGESLYAEIGLQSAIFTIFDLDTTSADLINADYFAGIPVTLQWDSLTWMARFYHQLSHLGNEYILKHSDIAGINHSYGMLDTLLSFEPAQQFRIYGGGGYVLYVDSGGYARSHYHTGVEFRVIADSPFVPVTVAALDVKGWKTPNWSAKLGLELNNNTIVSLSVYDGSLPDLRFYTNRITKFGISISYY
jgi:hypothetical protein